MRTLAGGLVLAAIAVCSAAWQNSQAITHTPLPQSVVHNVPFTTQAPLDEWSDPRQKDGCEETSILMALMWARGETYDAQTVRDYIVAMSEFQQHFYGYFQDSSAQDTTALLHQYFGYNKAAVGYNITTEDIKHALVANQLVIVPLNPRHISSTRYNSFTVRHTVVVVGYDNATNEIIFHDPLFTDGAYMRAPETAFNAALADYPSGKHRARTVHSTAMISVHR